MAGRGSVAASHFGAREFHALALYAITTSENPSLVSILVEKPRAEEAIARGGDATAATPAIARRHGRCGTVQV